MRTLIYPINETEPEMDLLESAARILRSGGLVAFPTETVYGLGASALDAAAAGRIYEAKGRPSDNPLIVHIAERAEAEECCRTTDLFYLLADAFWPGPLTMILPKRNSIPLSVTGGLDTVAVRMPAHPLRAACFGAQAYRLPHLLPIYPDIPVPQRLLMSYMIWMEELI